MSKLTREVLIQKMCESEPGLTKAAAGRLLNLVFDEIKDATVNGEGANFPGFGSFHAVETKARQARNFNTGEVIDIPAGRRVKFNVGKAFKDAL